MMGEGISFTNLKGRKLVQQRQKFCRMRGDSSTALKKLDRPKLKISRFLPKMNLIAKKSLGGGVGLVFSKKYKLYLRRE